MANDLFALLEAQAEARPSSLLYCFLPNGEISLAIAENLRSFEGLALRARQIAARLQERLQPGDRALLLYSPGLDFFDAFYGCLYAGVIAVPAALPSAASASFDHLRAIASASEVAVVLAPKVVSDFAIAMLDPNDVLRQKPWILTDGIAGGEGEWRTPRVQPETRAFIQFTSGSTSAPKGVILSHRNLIANQRAIHTAMGLREGQPFVSWLPLHHDMGLIGMSMHAVYLGSPCYLMSPLHFLQKPIRWLRAVDHFDGHLSGGPNFSYELCIRRTTPEERASLDLRNWEVAFNGSEPVSHETQRRFADAFAVSGFRREAFSPCYGLAEGSLLVTGGKRLSLATTIEVSSSALEHNKVEQPKDEKDDVRWLVSCGQAQRNHRVVIVDDRGRELAERQVGEIWLSGPSVGEGYWGLPEISRQTFEARLQDEPDGDFFLRTGDLGFLANGELFVTGRLKDLIIVRGRNIYPQDIEATVQAVDPNLRRGCGAAVALPIRQGSDGEGIGVLQEVHMTTEQDAMPLLEPIRQALWSTHRVQLEVLLLVPPHSLPKTTSGKLQRNACRQLLLDRALRPVAAWQGER